MAAKYSVPPSHKLALPRKFKKLLLDMARKNPEDRPSLAAAIKVTRFNPFCMKLCLKSCFTDLNIKIFIFDNRLVPN